MFWIDRGLGEGHIDTEGLNTKLEDLIDLNTEIIQQVRDIARACGQWCSTKWAFPLASRRWSRTSTTAKAADSVG